MIPKVPIQLRNPCWPLRLFYGRKHVKHFTSCLTFTMILQVSSHGKLHFIAEEDGHKDVKSFAYSHTESTSSPMMLQLYLDDDV